MSSRSQKNIPGTLPLPHGVYRCNIHPGSIRVGRRHMFAESLIESSGHTHTRRGWTMLFSMAIQTLALAIAIVIPMLITNSGPLRILEPPSTPIYVSRPTPPEPRQVAAHQDQARPDTPQPILEQPRDIPDHVEMTPARPIAGGPATPVCTNCEPRTDGNSHTDGPESKLDNGPHSKAVEVKKDPPHGPVRLSIVELGELTRRVQPVFPTLCRQLHCQGQVVLHAIISRQGTIESLE